MSAKRNATRNATSKPARKKGRKPKTAPDWRPVFIAELARTGNVGAAAKKAKVDRASAYRARDAEGRDPAGKVEAEAFGAAWDTALEMSADALELEARRRALTGWLEPKFFKGEACGYVRKFSDALLMFMLKAKRPHEFRENVSVDLHWRDAAREAGVADPDAFYEEIVRQLRQRMVRPDDGGGDPRSPAPAGGASELAPDA